MPVGAVREPPLLHQVNPITVHHPPSYPRRRVSRGAGRGHPLSLDGFFAQPAHLAVYDKRRGFRSCDSFRAPFVLRTFPPQVGETLRLCKEPSMGEGQGERGEKEAGFPP